MFRAPVWAPLDSPNPLEYEVDDRKWELHPKDFTVIPAVQYRLVVGDITAAIYVEYHLPKRFYVSNERKVLAQGDVGEATFEQAARYVYPILDAFSKRSGFVWATALIKKLDNGYRGEIQNPSERGLWEVGEEIFNRQFHPYPKGSLLRVRLNITAKGRKMVKEIVPVVPDGTGYRDVTLEELKATPADTGTSDPLARTLHSVVLGATMEMAKADEDTGSLISKLTAMTDLPAGAAVSLGSEVKDAGHGYFVGNQERLVFNAALAMSLRNPEKAVKVMMVGPSGYGKTSLPRLFAQVCGKEFLRMNCATVRDPEEWFGFREAKNGSTLFVRSEFAKAMERGNLVVVLDEFNRLEPWLHNTLFPLLDDDGCTVVHDERFAIGPGVIVVGTINTGYKYTGTFELDEALLNRFEFLLEVGPMPHEEEVRVLTERTGVDGLEASKVVKVANILRQNDVAFSTRTSLLVANMMVSGLYLREALETAVVKRIPMDSTGSALRKHVVDLINVELGPFVERTLDADIFTFGDKKPAAVSEKHHRVTLFLVNKSSMSTLKFIKLVHGLNVVGPKMSIGRVQILCNTVLSGETIVLELTGEPKNLDEFANVGVSAHYSTVEA